MPGTIQIDDNEYSVNAEFKDGTIQLADALDLDELESARLLLIAQQEAETLDRSALASAVIHFHENRQFLLECLRLVLRQSVDVDCEEGVRDVLRQLVSLVLDTKDGPARNGSVYAQKCMDTMSLAEKWLLALAERVQSTLTLGQTTTPDFDEIMEFQQLSLNQQHESLGAVLTYLVKANHTGVEDFHKLLDHLPSLDKWSSVAIHYVPIICACTSQYGSPEGSATLRESRTIHRKIMDARNTRPWALLHLQAAMITWWLAEYSGWYNDPPVGSPLQGVNLEAEAQARSDSMFQALRDGAFQFTLSVSSQIRPNDWYDPARQGLTQFLLRDTPVLLPDAAPMSPSSQELIMEQFENFADALIVNMPDTLRRFKTEEDDQRRKIHSGLQINIENGMSEHDLHLERFLVVMSYAYEGRVDAAQSFWADTEGNLYGFLQWASKRQSTPRVSAFCEMFRAISEGEECAGAAHHFLLEESNVTAGRLRKSSSLSWAQIFGELDFYASKIREHPVAVLPAAQYGAKPKPVEIDEPESAMMLECYLRLTSHLCFQSEEVRSWILTHETFKILDTLFLLCSSAVPKRIRACVYTTIRALLTKKKLETGNQVWNLLDQWVSSGFSPTLNLPRPTRVSNAAVWAEEITFETVATDFEESNAFVAMLEALMCPVVEHAGLNDALPFPEQLGSAYRMPGVEPYIDFVIGNILAIRIPQLEDLVQLRILNSNTLNFVSTCLGTFNENLLILANKSTVSVDMAMNTSSLLAYARLHPFCRVMEWMFNERVLAALFSASHQDINEVTRSLPDSPLILALLRSINVMNLIMDLQSTYLDIVRPLIKSETTGRRQPAMSPSLASFEDSVANNLQIIVDLGLYCGTGHPELVISSLKLLEKLASSRKLNAPHMSALGRRLVGNRIIGVLEQSNVVEAIARSLILAMEFDPRELSQGSEATGYAIKLAILNFLEHTLAASPGIPNLAHAMLGFACNSTFLSVDENGLFAKGSALFHVILRLVVEYPDALENSVLSWAMSLKQKGHEILQTLWKSPLTSVYSLTELRAGEFMFAQFLSQVTVDSSTKWDYCSFRDPEFLLNDSALAFEQYLRQRCSLLEYAGAEMRLTTMENIPSLRARIISTILGSTSMPNGDQLSNPTIFDLLDFLELDVAQTLAFPESQYFAGVDFSVTSTGTADGSEHYYDLRVIEELLALRYNELRKEGRLQEPSDEERASAEAQNLLLQFLTKNHLSRIESARMSALRAWVDLLTLIIESGDIDEQRRIAIGLQALQLTSSKLEMYAFESRPEGLVIARLINLVLSHIDLKSSSLERGRSIDVVNDRLFHLFRIALRSINIPGGSSSLREALYNICYRYLTSLADVSATSVHRRQSIQAVKAAGEKLTDVVCDDAYGGDGTCRVASLLLLDALTALAKAETSEFMVQSFVRTNFIVILVETLQDIPHELRVSNSNGQSSIIFMPFCTVPYANGLCDRRHPPPVLLQE